MDLKRIKLTVGMEVYMVPSPTVPAFLTDTKVYGVVVEVYGSCAYVQIPSQGRRIKVVADRGLRVQAYLNIIEETWE